MAIRLLLGVSKAKSARFIGSVASAHDVLQSNGYESTVSKLKNGLNVASYNTHRPTATVGLWIDSGSCYESVENNGVASLYEHLLYTGTAKRTAKQLQAELAKLGARLDSYTSREHTAYFAECLSEDVEKVVDILADVTRNTKLDADKIEQQRAVLLKRLEERDADYRGTLLYHLHMTAYQGTTLGFSPLGTASCIESLTKEDIINFADDHYKPVRMVLTGVGGVDHGQLEKLSEKYFGDLSNDYKQKIPQKTKARFTGSEMNYRDDTYPLMYGSIAVEGVPRTSLDAIALQIAKTAVGQYDRSHATSLKSPSFVIQKTCGVPELHSFEAFSLEYSHTGLFGFNFAVEGSNDTGVTEVCLNILRHWKHLAYGITDEEVDRYKNAYKTNLFTQLENNSNLADRVAIGVLDTGKITPLDQLERKIHFIDAAAMKESLLNTIYDGDIACAGIGRTEAWPSYHVLRSATSWWRV